MTNFHLGRQRKIWASAILFLCSAFVFSQEINSKTTSEGDSVNYSFAQSIKHSQFKAQFRNSFMATINDGPLPDYWTNAVGGRVGFETAQFHGFSFGAGIAATLKTVESDLYEKDDLTGKSAKWEKELYNYLAPDGPSEFMRLEELFIAYKFRGLNLKFGKQDINQGPLLLKRDGRMMPFLYRGLWGDWKINKKHQIQFAWIDKVAPRGLTSWYSINEAIGLNGNGFEPDGSKAFYHKTAESKGIAVGGWKYQFNKNFKAQIWDYYFHNLNNTTWAQIDGKYKSIYGGMQYAMQAADSKQSNLAYQERFVQPNEKAQVVSLKMGFKKNSFDISAAYLHAFDTGRFLFPRELGREDFYVSQPRSWIDGFGDTDVYMLRLKYAFKKAEGLKLDLRLSRTDCPAIDETEFNKYALASFYQSTLSIDYSFQKDWKGLDLMLLYIYKVNDPSIEIPLENRAYLYNIHHINLILNYNF